MNTKSKALLALGPLFIAAAGCATQGISTNARPEIPKKILERNSEGAIASWMAATNSWRQVNEGIITVPELVCNSLANQKQILEREQLFYEDIGATQKRFDALKKRNGCSFQ